MFADGTIIKTVAEAGNKSGTPRTEQPKMDRMESPKKSSRSNRSVQSTEKPTTPLVTTEEKRPSWVKTLPNGESMMVKGDNEVTHLNDVLLYVASDPQTKTTMATRDDNVVTVARSDGTLIVDHADGTRITSYYRENKVAINPEASLDTGEDLEYLLDHIKFVKVECPGYATIEYNCTTSESLTRFGNGSSLNVYADGYYMMHHGQGGKFEIDVEGVVIYYPQPNRYLDQLIPDRDTVYVMRHNTETLCETIDPEGNLFQAKFSGEGVAVVADTPTAVETHDLSTTSSDESIQTTTHKVIEYKNHAPRFFVIHADRSGTELLRYEDIAEYLIEAESNKNSAIIQETLPDQPNISGITVLKPYPGSPADLWLNEYDVKSIIPDGLRNRDLTTLPPREFVVPGPKFGHNLGQGLSIGAAVKKRPEPTVVRCPTKMEMRQFIQYKPVSDSMRSRLATGLHDYASHVQERNEFADKMKPIDPRTREEQQNADYLQNIALSMKQMREREPGLIGTLYEDHTREIPPTPSTKPLPKRTQADWERDERERQEERDGKEALRHMIVPPYFSSELGKAFLCSEAKDVGDLLRELGQEQRARASETSKLRGVITDTPDDLINKYGSPLPHPPNMSRNTTEASINSSTSPAQKEPSPITPVTTSSHARPYNPTPAHAMGMCSPHRPKNPTPGQGSPPPAGSPRAKSGQDGAAVDPVSVGYHSVKGQPIAEERDSTPDDISMEPNQPTTKSLGLTVTGELRNGKVILPNSVKGGRPGSFPNQKFSRVEDPVRRKVLNTGVIGGTTKGIRHIGKLRGLNLHPQRVHFGVLKEGSTYIHKVTLKNTGVDSCRFKIEQPPLSTGITVLFKPGPIAAGMSTDITLEIYAIASGVEGESGVGEVNHHISIITETDSMLLPVKAIVLTGHDFDHRTPDTPEGGKSPGTVLVSSTPPALTGIIRPRKSPNNNRLESGKCLLMSGKFHPITNLEDGKSPGSVAYLYHSLHQPSQELYALANLQTKIVVCLMAQYIPNVNASTLATVKDELARREQRQKIHYFYLNELQKMARELPGKYQQRLPYDLLSSLANALLDGTVFAITGSLVEVQQLEERNLFNQRVRLVNEHKAQRQEMQKKQKQTVFECQARPHNLPLVQSQNERELEVLCDNNSFSGRVYKVTIIHGPVDVELVLSVMEKRFDEEIKKKDMKIIMELDQKVMDQQSTLEKAGVPGFYVTNAPHDIRLQMYLLEFITKLADLKRPGIF